MQSNLKKKCKFALIMLKKDIYTAERACEFMGDFVNLLTPEQKESLLANVSVCTLKPGEELYHEGNIPQFMCCVVNGHIKISRLGVGGRNIILRLIHNGGIFGYRSYFSKSQHITTATAVTRAVVYLVPLNVIDDWMVDNTILTRFFVNELAEDLGHSDQRLLNLTQKHLRGRLAEAILLLAENFGFCADGRTIAFEPSREELADMANMTRSNAIRTLSDFAKEEIVSVDHRRIAILDMQKLEMNSNFG